MGGPLAWCAHPFFGPMREISKSSSSRVHTMGQFVCGMPQRERRRSSLAPSRAQRRHCGTARAKWAACKGARAFGRLAPDVPAQRDSARRGRLFHLCWLLGNASVKSMCSLSAEHLLLLSADINTRHKMTKIIVARWC